MSQLSDELELQLEKIIEEHEEHYSSSESARQWITQDFAEWLVKKFEKEVYHAKTR
jgi:hypothetical protein